MVTVYVAGDGTGDYNCDGTDDQVQINQALAYAGANPGTIVHLKGPFNYRISDSIITYSDTILEGDATVCIKVHTGSLWPKDKAMIKQNSPTEAGKGYIKIRGFEIDGQADTLMSLYGVSRGDSYYTMMWLFYDDVEISNLYLHDGLNDCLKVQYSKEIVAHDNVVYKPGHEFIYAQRCENLDMYNNNVRCKTNSACRPFNTNHVKIHNNIIWGIHESDGGGPGLQIQYGRRSSINVIMDDIEVFNNVFYDTYGPGIALVAYLDQSSSDSGDWGTWYSKTEACNVRIHNNIFYDCGSRTTIGAQGGVVTTGFDNVQVYNNTFDGVYCAGVFAYQPLVGVPNSAYLVYGSGYTVDTWNNIFSNIRLREYSSAGTGYGLANELTSTHIITSKYNCFYNNAGGNYRNVTAAASDIYVDPLYADRTSRDYHLKSTAGRWNKSTWVIDTVHSPCIDAGDPSSDYTHEPVGNGSRVNVGAYGNTVEASKSVVVVGENGVLIPLKNGQYLYYDGSTLYPGDNVVIYPAKDGQYYAMKAGGSTGQGVIVIPGKDGNYQVVE